jgi:prepilin-type N-terminal cleavage/methylation domain-containing protein
LFRKRLREESGYSLVEVMVSIIILAIAILPMASMFDMGLNSATAGSKYDKARALANLKMEEAKSLPFDSADDAIQDVKDNFPELPPPAGTLTTYDEFGHYTDVSDPPKTEPGFPNSMTYVIEKQYMQPPTDSGDWNPSDTPTGLIRVTVTVNWDGNTYHTFGLVAE